MTTQTGEKLLVLLASGRKIEVDSHGTVGAFVIHRRVWKEREYLDGYTVTHRATTLAVWTVSELGAAIRVAEWLMHHKLIPEGAQDCLMWQAALAPAERTRLIAELQALAPRLIPGGLVE